MEEILTVVREKYVEDLEDILQCPICMELTSGLIVACVQGHHICEKCKSLVKNCPSCQNPFGGSRNYLAEKLLSKFDDIKTSILEPHHVMNKKNLMCISTQTFNQVNYAETQTEIHSQSVSIQTNYSESSIETQTDFKGVDAGTQTEEVSFDAFIPSSRIMKDMENESTEYLVPCLIGTCGNMYLKDRIISHLKFSHNEKLIEINEPDEGSFTKTWTIEYTLNQSFNYAIKILDAGLFFFSIVINDEGDLYGRIQAASNYCTGQKWYYLLLIMNAENPLLSEIFKGIVPIHSLEKKNSNEINYCISKSSLTHNRINDNALFDCTLTLYRPEDS